MNQDEINEREWGTPDNWGKRFGFYRSRLDSRIWVRKPKPWMGLSLNLAHPLGKVLVFLFLLLMCLLVVGALLLVLPGLH
jgi:uncharacterized membrane protein